GDRPGHASPRVARGGRTDHAAHHGVALAAAISAAIRAHRDLNCPRGVLAIVLLDPARPSSWTDARVSSHPVPPAKGTPGSGRCAPTPRVGGVVVVDHAALTGSLRGRSGGTTADMGTGWVNPGSSSTVAEAGGFASTAVGHPLEERVWSVGGSG